MTKLEISNQKQTSCKENILIYGYKTFDGIILLITDYLLRYKQNSNDNYLQDKKEFYQDN